jgi:hypothetical protein
MLARIPSKCNLVFLAALALVLVTKETMMLGPFMLMGDPTFAGEQRRMEVAVAVVDDDAHDVDTTSTLNSKHNTIMRSHRPKLVLHVGPPKTATTFLQCSLCTASSSTKSETILAQDSWVYLGTCPDSCGKPRGMESSSSRKDRRYLEHVHGTFFSRTPNNARNNSSTISLPVLGPEFLQRLAAARETGKNALIIFENLHRISDQHVAVLAEQFSMSDWDVEIVVAYRHLYDWLPSKYNQMYRPSKLKLNAAEWPGETNRPTEGQEILPFDLENRSDFTALVQDIESTGLHPTATVVKKYQPYFVTHVVDLHNLQMGSDTRDAYLRHLFCHVLQAGHTCLAVATGAIGTDGIRSNPSPSLHYEMLAVRAYQQGLISHVDSTANGRSVSRHVVVLAIQRRQEIQLNLTANDFPLKCLPYPTLDRLIDLSVQVDANLFGYSVEREVQHRVGFAAKLHAKKYCHIDVDRVLQDDGWRNMLFSLGHGPRGGGTRSSRRSYTLIWNTNRESTK